MNRTLLYDLTMMSRTSAALLVLCIVLPIRAQVSGGTISGTVLDPSGAAVDKAQIDAVDDASNKLTHTVTSSGGLFNLPNLDPGNYTVTVTVPGFTASRLHVLVEISKDTVVKVPLSMASTTAVVDVASNVSPVVDVDSSTLNQVVDGKTTRELPLNGRDWTMLSVLEPNVHTTDNQLSISAGDNSRANRGVGTQITISGTRPQQNVYRLDGIITNDYSGNGPGGALGGTLGVDAIQEFSVTTSNATADYGRSSGGTVSAVTRAGGDKFHGSAYEFIRNSALDATPYFNTAGWANSGKPPFKRNQFGGTVGGPILKNRLFFFFNYEGLRQSRTTSQQTTVPSPNARQGYLVCTQNATASNAGCLTAIGGTKAPAGSQGVQLVPGIDPAVTPYLQFFPVPNGAINGDTGTFNFNSQATAKENLYTGRMDYTFSQKDTAHVSALDDSSEDVQPDAYNFIYTGLQPDRKLFAVAEQHTFSSSVINSARIGYAYTFVVSPSSSTAINPLATDTSYGFVPNYPIGNLAIGGLTSFYGGVNVEGLYSYRYRSYQAGDDVFWTKGRHNFQFGVSFEDIQSNDRGTTTAGYYTFNSYTSFLQNKPQSFASSVAGNNIPIYMREKVYGGYVNDAWHVAHNVTLNLGVRYEPTSDLTEAHGHFSVLQTAQSGSPVIGGPLFKNPTHRNFAPRVGVAWDPFSNGKTVIRGGYGIYDTLPLTYMFILSTLNVAPFNQTVSVTNPAQGSFPKQTYLTAINNPTTPNKYAYVQQSFGRPYVEQYLLNIQQQIAKNTAIEIGYARAHGVRQPTKSNDGNIVEPLNPSDIHNLYWPTATLTTTTTSAGSSTKLTFQPAHHYNPNTNIGQTDSTYFNQSTSYNALNASVRRFTANTRIGVTYTWSKSLDSSSSSNGGSNFTNTSTIAPFTREIGAFKGLSDFNVGSNLSVSALYIVPGSKGGSWLHYMGSGWQIGGIGRSATGLPFTALISGDALGLQSASVFDYPDRIYSTPGCQHNPVNLADKVNYLNRSCFVYPQGINRVTTTKSTASTTTTTTTYNPTFGNEQRNSIIGPGINSIDFSLVKDTSIEKIHEGFHAEFRAEFFNLLNHPMFEVPGRSNTAVFTAAGNSISPQVLTSISVPERQIQFGLKLIF